MKRLFLSAALAGTMLAAGLTMTAQTATSSQSDTTATQQQSQQTGRKHWHHRGKHRMAMMAKKLNLSQDQQNQLKPIFQKQHEQAKAIKNDNSLTQDQKKEKFQALHQDTMAQVNNILTPEQQQQWEQMRQKHQQGNKGESQAPAPQGQ